MHWLTVAQRYYVPHSSILNSLLISLFRHSRLLYNHLLGSYWYWAPTMWNALSTNIKSLHYGIQIKLKTFSFRLWNIAFKKVKYCHITIGLLAVSCLITIGLLAVFTVIVWMAFPQQLSWCIELMQICCLTTNLFFQVPVDQLYH